MTLSGSLCSGYGGLDLAVEEVFGAETIWHADLEPAAAKILAHRWPGVPNFGDIKLTHWGRVPKVDIITAGYPCQPFSHAGRRGGTEDPRHLWPFVAQAVRRVRPRWVVLENVAGHRSLGFDTVLGDLAAMRYVGSWVSLRASDVGACHGRERVFILARDTESFGRDEARSAVGRGERAGQAGGSDFYAADAAGARRAGEHGSAGREAARRGQERVAGRSAGGASTTDADVAGLQGGEPAERRELPDWGTAPDAVNGAWPASGRRSVGPGQAERSAGAATDAHRQPLRLQPVAEPGRRRQAESGHAGVELASRAGNADMGQDGGILGGMAGVDWGKYGAAVRRHERLVDRRAPQPSELAPKGGQRLAPRFVEWMQCLDDGWVCDVPGLTRDEQLHALGNGVVPPQAVAALRRLLSLASAAT